MKLAPDGWRWPRLVSHLFDHPSTTVSLGLWLFIVASWGAFLAANDRKLSAENWLWCVIFASVLVGGVRVGKNILEAMAMRVSGDKAADVLKAKEKEGVPPSSAA